MAIKQTFHVDKHCPSDHQVRETWYSDEVQRYYLSTVHIESIRERAFSGANASEPEETISDTPDWRVLPGTNHRYEFALKRTAVTDADSITTTWASFCMKKPIWVPEGEEISVRLSIALNSHTPPAIPDELWSFDKWDSYHSKWHLFSDLFENQLVPGSATITICIQEPDDLGYPLASFPFDIAQAMGSCLLSPDNGDVVFETISPTEESRKLYAWKFVLSTRSQYYATMFKSSFSEGESDGVDVSANSGRDYLCRTHIKVEDNFDLLHNILYYLHTNQISFGTDLTYEPPEKYLPKLSAAEDIYAMADRLLLDELKSKAFDFLRFTCTEENITARVFSKFSMLYKEIGDMYATYFLEEWEDVKDSRGYKEFFSERELEADIGELIKLFRRYRALMEDYK